MRLSKRKGWKFLVDEEAGGRLLTLDTSKTFDNLRAMVCEDFGIDVNLVNIELSYLPSNLVGFNLNEEAVESPNREEVAMSYEVSGDIDGEIELEEEDAKIDESDDENKCEKDMINGKSVRFSLIDVVNKGQHFTSKTALQATMEICAMKHNFDYKVSKSDKRVWNHSVRTGSSKTVGSLIMHKYERVKKGLKLNDIIQFMQNDHGVEISYSLAWEARLKDDNGVTHLGASSSLIFCEGSKVMLEKGSPWCLVNTLGIGPKTESFKTSSYSSLRTPFTSYRIARLPVLLILSIWVSTPSSSMRFGNSYAIPIKHKSRNFNSLVILKEIKL
ncbi:hypothetical protein F2Q69_00015359 [Brassica cretica]|uniref:Uncharacterized protein n=1 Tax=Brassica cretica TaxID=69181 RepID=A0A8S9QY42_BRACR|nr:hypothetical protein F2Q69_00015359 [Brassica cretica]